MKVYYFSESDWQNRLKISRERLNQIIAHLSGGVDTSDLVIAIYFLSHNHPSGGIAIVQQYITQQHFNAKRGRWSFTKYFSVPDDLPKNFKLIRLKFNLNEANYPLQQIDQYGWQWRYHSFSDHFAFLFAHEFHHFRRYHLGLHEREGEHSANKWALNLLKRHGYNIEGQRVIFKIKKRKTIASFLKRVSPDRFQKFRELRCGDAVLINYDPQGRYDREIAAVVRPLRKNAKRLVIETKDGKRWRWPVEWIHVLN